MSDEELRTRFATRTARARATRPTRRVVRTGRTKPPAPSHSLPDEGQQQQSSPAKPSRSWRLSLPRVPSPVIAAVVLGIAVIGGYFLLHRPTPVVTDPAAQAAARLVSIPVYYPQNLPAGYTYNNDAKTIQANILYFSITGPGNQTFYVTQQSIPPNFDFSTFNEKFLNPDNFSSDAGSVIAGPVGGNLIGSVQTDKNTWIIINSPGTNSQTELETVVRSLEFVQS
jgi:hypothetical protein